jgi:trans-aconitate 2-methyltransferase
MKFGNERTQPSIDLVNRIHCDREPKSIIDIGCGFGNSSLVLMKRWPSAYFLGIDSSIKMIEKAKMDFPIQDWQAADASHFSSEIKFDIVYSNATIQWIPHHETLIGNFTTMLSEHGVLAMQMPKFRDMPIGKIMDTIAQKPKWREKLHDCKKVCNYSGL